MAAGGARGHAWRRASLAVLATCLTISASSQGAATTDALLFTIAKSENRNLVQYSARVDAQCVPIAGAPVHAYWRMLQEGPSRTAPLLAREQKAYGVRSQQVVEPVTAGAAGAVRVVLAALPDRPLLVEIWRSDDGTCRALTTLRIAGAPAHLFDVYIRLRSPFGVDYVLLQGWTLDGTRRVDEKLGT